MEKSNGRGLKISRKKTEYLGCNEHRDSEIHLQRETVKRVKTFTYMGSTLAEDGELDAEVTHRVQSGWKNCETWALEKLDKIRNERIRGTTKVGEITKIGPGREVEVVWACDEKRGTLCRKEGDGNEIT